MKKLLLLSMLCLSFATPRLMAAYQYGDYVQLSGSNLNVINSGSLTLNFSSSITDWDTITVAATDTSGNVTTNTYNISGNSVSIGDVLQGTTLKFYLTNDVGTTMDAQFWGSGWDTAANTYEYLHFGGNYGQWGQYYTIQDLQVEGGTSPSGQPLPGVAISLLLGGASLYAMKKKKAKAVA